MRGLLIDSLIGLAVVLGSASVGILFNLTSNRGIDPFGEYSGYGQAPLPTVENPEPLPPVGINTPLSVKEARARVEVLTFVDARPAEAYAAGHVPDAVTVPYSFQRMMPADQGGGYSEAELAPLSGVCEIVIYDEGDGSAETVLSDLRARFPVVRVLEGGAQAWRAAGGPWVDAARTEGGGR